MNSIYYQVLNNESLFACACRCRCVGVILLLLASFAATIVQPVHVSYILTHIHTNTHNITS